MNHLAFGHVDASRFNRERVANAWKAFVAGGSDGRGDVREIIAESWDRCRCAGVDPLGQRAPHVGIGAPLERLIERHSALLEAAAHTWQVFSESLVASGSIFIVTDPAGVMLDVRGNSELLEAAARQHVAPGFDWSERASGTNAVGTALMLECPTIVRTVEHFCVAAKIWDCAASLVRDLSDGTVLGVLDVTSIGGLSDSHTLALAVTVAKQIEHTLHSRELAHSVQLLNWYRASRAEWQRRAAVLLDRKGRVITATDAALELLGMRHDAFTLTEGAPALSDRNDIAVVDCLAYEWPKDLRDPHPSTWEGGVALLASRHRGSTGLIPRVALSGTRPRLHAAFDRITTADPGLLALMHRAERMARARSPILLTGETGSGKELFARAIHASSPVSGGPFIAVNCGTLTKELAASELLGYESGAFTGASPKGHRGKFEEADRGTLFLDEVGELPPDVQVHLLRVLQDNVVVRVGGHRERKVDVRIVAATNREPEQEVEAGRFRRDLYYRLKVLILHLPPLRERLDDIPMLVEAILRKMQGTYGLGAKRASPELIESLKRHRWPGNVRELHGLVESLYILSNRPVLTAGDLPLEFCRLLSGDGAGSGSDVPVATLDRVERNAIEREIALTPHNLSGVAKRLGISRSTLYRRMKQYAIER